MDSLRLQEAKAWLELLTWRRVGWGEFVLASLFVGGAVMALRKSSALRELVASLASVPAPERPALRVIQGGRR